MTRKQRNRSTGEFLKALCITYRTELLKFIQLLTIIFIRNYNVDLNFSVERKRNIPVKEITNLFYCITLTKQKYPRRSENFLVYE